MFRGKVKQDFENWLPKYFTGQSPKYLTYKDSDIILRFYAKIPAMQFGVYLAYIRENRGVLIVVYRNGSGYLWSMECAESGTNYGDSGYSGDCEMSGAFTSYDLAMTTAIELQGACSLDAFKSETPNKKFHWGNYADFIIEHSKKLEA